MKQNLLVVSYDYDVSKRLAHRLADSFSMRVLDAIELFEFDHIPFSFEEILKKNGPAYVSKKMRSILKMELDFDDAVFVANNDFADTCADLFYKIKLSNFVILLKKDIDLELKELNSKQFNIPEQKEFYVLSKETLEKREETLEHGCADIVIDIKNLNDDEIVENIIDKIKNYYSVN